MDQRRILLVLRHAQTEDIRPGSRDTERRLTPDGERQARQVGEYLRAQGITVDNVLCSSAARARKTLELLQLSDQLDANRVEIADRFYNAGGRFVAQRRTRAARRLLRRSPCRTRPRRTQSGARDN